MHHVPHHVPAHFYGEYVRALHSGDVNSVRHIMLVLAEQGFTADQVIRDLIAPGQREIGQAWGGSKLTVAEEHEATAIAEEALVLLLDSSSDAADGQLGDVVLCAAQGEWHSIAARMVAAVWRHLGWNVHLLVPSVPAADIRELLAGSPVVLSGVTCAMSANLFGAWRVISALRELGCWVIAGGRGFGPPARGEMGVRTLGADAFAPDPMSGHEVLLRLRALGPPGRRPGVDLGERGHEAERLMRDALPIVSDCVSLADGLRPQLITDERAARQASDDLRLLFHSAVSAALIDAPWIMSDHASWYREMMLASGADPNLGNLWIDTLLSRLPSQAHYVRAVLAATPRG